MFPSNGLKDLLMNCNDIERSLSLFIDDELPDETAALFRLHLEECAACTAQYKTMVKFQDRLLQLKPVPVPGDFRARFWQRVREENPGTLSVWSKIARWAMPVSVACTSLVALLVVSMSVSPILYAAGNTQARHEAVVAACGTFAGWSGSSLSGLANFSCFCDRCDMRTCKQCAAGQKCTHCAGRD
jgi:anti-sigma factor RsiW